MIDFAASHVWLPEGNYSKTHPALILHVKGSSAGGRQPKLLAQKSACAPLQIPQMVKGFPSIEATLIFFQTPLLPHMINGAGQKPRSPWFLLGTLLNSCSASLGQEHTCTFLGKATKQLPPRHSKATTGTSAAIPYLISEHVRIEPSAVLNW